MEIKQGKKHALMEFCAGRGLSLCGSKSYLARSLLIALIILFITLELWLFAPSPFAVWLSI